MTNKLIEVLDTTPEYKYFVFDGQTIVLEDYLEIHPENKDKLKKYVSEKRLFVGPWYVLPDEFLVSGESIIRNLVIGHKIAKEFGNIMKVGYIPDPFGHISQLPQILVGFGIDSFIHTRGISEEYEKLGSEFIWDAPDGSSVLAVRSDYWHGADLGYRWDDEKKELITKPLDLEGAYKRVKDIVDSILKYSRTPYLLLNNGTDHKEPQPELPQIIEYLNTKFPDIEFVHSNYENYIKAIKESNIKFLHYQGELRSGYLVSILPNVYSSRIYLKQNNERMQTKLEKYTEPLATFAFLEGNKYPSQFLLHAWKYLLKCHPHDSICGCSHDDVHRDMLRRFTWIREIGDRIEMESRNYLTEKINTILNIKNAVPVVVFNTLGWIRENEPVELIFPEKLNIKKKCEYVIYDEENKKYYPTEIIDCGYDWNPQEGEYNKYLIKFIANMIPSCGYKVYSLIPITDKISEYKFDESDIRKENNSIENKYYKIVVNKNGTLKIKDKKTNTVFDQLLLFEDIEDAGDEYNFSPIKNSKCLTTSKNKAKISVINISPVSATIKIDTNFFVPTELTEDRKNRSKKVVNCPITTYVTLYSNLDRVDFRTVITNNAKDHRIRVLFPTTIKTKYTFTEEQFCVVKRPIGIPSGKNWKSGEQPCGTQPQQSYVSINDSEVGFTLINQGLPEYEAVNTKKGITIALTLLRCIGWLSRNDFITRKGHAGPFVPTPDAQCLGTHEFRYSLVIHKNSWDNAKVWYKALGHNVPLIAVSTRQHDGYLGKKLSFIEIENNNHLIVSAIKKSENEDKLILRLFNTTGNETKARIKFYKKIKHVQFVTLNEELTGTKPESVASNIVEFKVAPFKIITLAIDF